MNETVTIDKAISRGHRMVNFPVAIIMLGIIGLSIYLSIKKVVPFWGIPIGFVLGFVFAWLWWSVMITKWRLWAFENIRNVHELKNRAIQENLIWPDNSVFEKTEIWTAADRERWNALQIKFKQKDLFQDNPTIPDETIVYYSKGKNLLEMAIMLGGLVLGVKLIVKDENYVLGVIFSIVGVYFGIKEYKETTNKTPQIILNDDGIVTVATTFYNWREIENEKVVREGIGKNIRYYLVYDHPDGSEHLSIHEYDIDHKKLNKLLILYRGRNEKKTKNKLV